jgi:hypothetical protein
MALFLGLTLLSCSSLSVIFIRNDTNNPLSYTVEAQMTADHGGEKGKFTASGSLLPGERAETIRYFSNTVRDLKIDLSANGKSTTLHPKSLPESMTRASSGGLNSVILITDKGVDIRKGSGNSLDDLQHSSWPLNMLCCPLFGLVLLGVAIKVIGSATKTPVRRYD